MKYTSQVKQYTIEEFKSSLEDLNKGITKIEYDLLGNPLKVNMKDGNNIEYVYAADGTRLKATHNTKLSAGRYSSRDRYYRGNLLFTRSNDKLPYTVLVPGGYYFYESADDAFFLSLYVQDYQGNNRVELYDGNSVCQQTHYYPFGGIIGDLSSSSSFNAGNDFKYSGKELDRNFGLDLYDFHARQYDPLIPGFHGQDKHAEKYYWLSPYNYCAGNPVNCVDPDGKDIYNVSWNGYITLHQKRPNDSYHTINRVERGSGKVLASINVEDKQMVEKLEGPVNCGDRAAVSTNGEEALTLFCFLAENTTKEWCLNTYSTENGEKHMIGTSHLEGMVCVGDLENKTGMNSSEKIVDRHSHQGETGLKGGSGYDGANGDKQNISKWKADNPGKKEPIYLVYHSYTKTFYQYTENNQGFVVNRSDDVANKSH